MYDDHRPGSRPAFEIAGFAYKPSSTFVAEVRTLNQKGARFDLEQIAAINNAYARLEKSLKMTRMQNATIQSIAFESAKSRVGLERFLTKTFPEEITSTLEVIDVSAGIRSSISELRTPLREWARQGYQGELDALLSNVYGRFTFLEGKLADRLRPIQSYIAAREEMDEKTQPHNDR